MRTVVTGVMGLLLATGVAVAQTASEREVLLRDFQSRVAAYTTPHQCLDVFSAALNATAPPPQIFTAPVAMVFRQLIATALASVDTTTVMRGAGVPAHRAHVLDALPAETGTLPPLLERALPPLPAGVEYRLVDNDLVLRDTTAGVVVAVLRNAVGVTALK